MSNVTAMNPKELATLPPPDAGACAGGGPLALAGPRDLLIQTITTDALVERVGAIKDAMKRCMVDGQHHGIIPGTKKPSLWKPGAELICTLFQLGTRYPKQSMLIERENNHFLFTLTCELFHIPSGRVVGEGVGACTTREYRYRVQVEPRTDARSGQLYPARFTPWDFYNTCLKIAKKRAMVDAILTATGASEIFTQDTEDNPELYGEVEAREVAPPAPPKARPAGRRADNPATPLEGVISRAWASDYQGKRYWFAYLVPAGGAEPVQLQTTEEALGGQLEAAAGSALRAWVEPSPKPGKVYLKRIESLEPPAAAEPPATATDRVAKRAAARARHEGKAPPKPQQAEEQRAADEIPLGDNPDWERLEALMRDDEVREYWLLKALKTLGWIPEGLQRLADVSPKTIRVIVESWPQVGAAALKAEGQGKQGQQQEEPAAEQEHEEAAA